MIRINDTQEFNDALSSGMTEVRFPSNTNLLLFASSPSPDYADEVTRIAGKARRTLHLHK